MGAGYYSTCIHVGEFSCLESLHPASAAAPRGGREHVAEATARLGHNFWRCSVNFPESGLHVRNRMILKIFPKVICRPNPNGLVNYFSGRSRASLFSSGLRGFGSTIHSEIRVEWSLRRPCPSRRWTECWNAEK